MKRRLFLQQSALLSAGVVAGNLSFAKGKAQQFKDMRPPVAKRHFKSDAIEKVIKEFQSKVKNKELAWLFSNCFPNTLDTTVDYQVLNGRPDTYVITGDIDAMWLRDSSAQVWPYLPFMKEDKKLQDLIAGVINRQSANINIDPYANAFYKDADRVGDWKDDITDMKSGIHERKWEIDSLCYPIRLAYAYWKTSGDTSPFDNTWVSAQKKTLQTFIEQQRKEDLGPYKFERETPRATDTLPMDGYGYPVKPVGLICSSFRPSDDASVFSFLIPSNAFAVISLRESAEMLKTIAKDEATATKMLDLANEVEAAIKKHGIVDHPIHGRIYAFEVDGFGSYLMMDDSNVPSLLSLPYLDAVTVNDPVYQRTRNYVLSPNNPFFFKGKVAEGVGGPHIGLDMVWPMSIVMRAMTTSDENEIKKCIDMLRVSNAGTGFMHESFHKDDPSNFTRSWFAWTNTLFGELLWKIYKEKPHLLNG